MPVMRHLTVGNVTYDTVGEASVTQVQTSGTKIATVSIDGASTDIYAPSGGGGGSTWTDISNEFSVTASNFTAKTDGKLVFVSFDDATGFMLNLNSQYMPVGTFTGACMDDNALSCAVLFDTSGASSFISESGEYFTGSIVYLCVGAFT